MYDVLLEVYNNFTYFQTIFAPQISPWHSAQYKFTYLLTCVFVQRVLITLLANYSLEWQITRTAQLHCVLSYSSPHFVC